MNSSKDTEQKEQARDLSSLFQEIKTDLTSYINTRVMHYRLDLLERTGKSSSLLAMGLILAFLGFSTFAFALIALGFFLGDIFSSNAIGFSIVALFWLLLLIIILLLREPIKKFFLNRTIRLLYKIEKEDRNGEE